ncbi:MAG: hypothetical protein EPN84_03795 [Legionella sp.]|nr:MAG: hypothetical protein EPN84_03795 [Legionella sp.]
MNRFEHAIMMTIITSPVSSIATLIGGGFRHVPEPSYSNNATTVAVGGLVTGAIASAIVACFSPIRTESSKAYKITFLSILATLTIIGTITGPLIGEQILKYKTNFEDVLTDEMLGLTLFLVCGLLPVGVYKAGNAITHHCFFSRAQQPTNVNQTELTLTV